MIDTVNINSVSINVLYEIMTSCNIYFSGGSKSDAESIKAKNIVQTELMIRLRDAILRVSRYFQVSTGNIIQSMTNLNVKWKKYGSEDL